MTHTALARRYRPTRFADLVGQEHVAVGLAGAVAKNRVAHGYLLTGPRGVGKTTAARILAMALNCEAAPSDTPGEPCGVCDSCQRIWSGAANLDVVEIDAASNRGVDDARDLRERAMYAASSPGRHKVYIVDEAHMLTREAWNALLKILEEPPPGVVFVFATTEPQKIANTTSAVISRLQRFDFRSLGPRAIESRLRQVVEAEGIEIEPDALVLVARVANGGMRDALSLLDQALVFGEGTITALRVREALGLVSDEVYGELLDIVAEGRTADVFPLVARVVDEGGDLGEFVNGMGEVLRALMISLSGGTPQGLTATVRDAVARAAETFAAGDVLRMLRLLGEAELTIRRSQNPRLHVEALLLQWALLDRTVDLAGVLAGLGGGAPPESGEPSPGEGRRRSGRSGSRAGAAKGGPDGPAASQPAPRHGDTAPRELSTLEDVLAAWPAVLEAVGDDRPMLREVLAGVEPHEFTGDAIVVAVDEGARDGIQRGKEAVEGVLARLAGRPIRLELAGPSGEASGRGPARRQTADADRDTRLQVFRRQDPALDAMTEALDLELQE